ncbi:YhcN/YlaJ family sporulation lipoprotein [Aneurinibacillus tyrosinisolvens]|uniref:YhcN/YlaJ family sporulation lipoprotein n=1 Tax=Aneurinibacillus tyrosinisolvens TaxID=1443435 RepID=UPI00069C5653|nr:YhcN/YlaJ family sporulation lipoprotein [Aneurinibacillus tyrosinisolvens]
MKKTIKRITVASFTALIAGSMAACSPGGVPNTNRAQENQVNGYRTNSAAPHYNSVHRAGMPDDGSRTYNRSDGNHTVTARITQAAAKVPGVTHVTAVVDGNNAVVGLDVDNTAVSRPNIEFQVRRAVQAAEPGYNVHVTTDGALHQRIRTLNTQRSNGHSARTQADGVGTLIRNMGRTEPFR